MNLITRISHNIIREENKMKNKSNRFCSLLLSLSMIAGMLIACFPGVQAQDQELPRKMVSWKGQALADEAAKTGLKNRQGLPVFTTYQDQVGIQTPKDTSDFVIHSWFLPHGKKEALNYQSGDLLTLVIRVWNPDGDLANGDFVTPELCYDWSGVNDMYGQTMTADDYAAAKTYTDETYGYQYKEWTCEAILESDVYDDPSLEFQIRVRSHGNGTLNIYGVSVYNETAETTLIDANGSQIAGQSNITPVPITQGDTATGIVSYCGEVYAGRGEPYSLYNTNGIQGCSATPGQSTDIVSDPDGAVLLSGFATPLAAGNYRLEFDFATQFSLGVEKATFYVMQGDETVSSFPYTLFTLNERFGKGKDGQPGLYDTVQLDFTVGEEQAGSEFSVKIVLVNRTDFYLRGIHLYKKVAADATPDAVSQEVIDAIQSLSYQSTQQEIDAVRDQIDALTLEQHIWIEDSMLDKLDHLTVFQTELSAINSAIADIGALDETNYTEKLPMIEKAEQMLTAFDQRYGEEGANIVAARTTLQNARAAYERLAAEALAKEKQNAANQVIAAINAIGEVTADNYTTKKELIEAAETSQNDFINQYGESALELITNLSTLRDARNTYDQLIATPPVTFGDLDGQDGISANDALVVLQYTVDLTSLTEYQQRAADVNQDNNIDTKDALFILQRVVGLIDSFPAEQTK